MPTPSDVRGRAEAAGGTGCCPCHAGPQTHQCSTLGGQHERRSLAECAITCIRLNHTSRSLRVCLPQTQHFRHQLLTPTQRTFSARTATAPRLDMAIRLPATCLLAKGTPLSCEPIMLLCLRFIIVITY